MNTPAESTICFFNSTKTWGGGEKWHFDMAVELHRKGYRVMVITNPNSELQKRLKNTDIKTENKSVSNLSFLNLYKLWHFRDFFRKHRISAIILNLPADLKTAGVAARMAGVEQIYYRRGSAIPVKNTMLNRFLFRRIVTGIITNSQETKRCLLANNAGFIDEKKIHTIYNGLKIHFFENRPFQLLYQKQQDEIVIGNAGRLVKQKGQKLLLDIALLLKNEKVNFKLLIAGKGPLETELKEYTKELELSDNVVFTGFVENIKDFMCSIDVFVLTSLWEGFGYVITEAMACEKPVIAFNVSSNPEIIDNGQTGYLVEKNDLSQFAAHIKQLAENEDLRQQMGKAGRQRLEKNFTMKTTVKKVCKLLEKKKV